MTRDRKQIILGVVTGLAVLVACGALAVALIALHKDQTLQVQVEGQCRRNPIPAIRNDFSPWEPSRTI